MRILGFGDVTFAPDWTCSIPDDWVPSVTVEPTILNRAGTYAAFAPGVIGPMEIPAVFLIPPESQYNGNFEDGFQQLLARLNPLDLSPKQLRAQFNSGDLVSRPAVLRVQAFKDALANMLPVHFVTVQAWWDADVARTASKTFSVPADEAMQVTVQGQAPVQPVIRIQPTVARTTKTSNVGWSFRRRYTIQNLSTRPCVNYAYALDIGNTQAIVTATKALASGNDLRVVIDGREVARSLTDWNAASFNTLVWFLIPNLVPGASLEVQILYGNATAGTPPVLVYPDKPAYDIATAGATRSTAAFKRYLVDRTAANNGVGGWYLDSGTSVPRLVDTSVPGAWSPERTFINSDDSQQQLFSSYTASGTKYQARFDAQRGRDSTLAGQLKNLADGVVLRDPLGIVSVRADFRFQNQACGGQDQSPVGKLVLLTRNSPAHDWQVVSEATYLQASEATITVATYTPAAPVAEFAMAVWPQNGRRIKGSARLDRFVYADWWTILEVTVDASNLQVTATEAETAVYELATRLTVGGSTVAPYRSLRIGNATNASGEGTPRLTCQLNEQVRIDTATRTAELWNSGLTAKVADVPVGVIAAAEGYWSGNATLERVSTDWLPLPPSINPFINPAFTVNALGWTRVSATAGMTAAAMARANLTFGAAAGGGNVAVSANTGGVGSTVVDVAEPIRPVANRGAINVCAWLQSSNANLQPTLGVTWYTSAGVLISTSVEPDWTVVANTPVRHEFSARAPAGATQWRFTLVTKSKTSNQTGNVWIDDVTALDADIELSEVSMGTLVLAADWVGRHV